LVTVFALQFIVLKVLKPELGSLRQKFYDLAEDIENNRTGFTSADINVMYIAVDNFIKVCDEVTDIHTNLLDDISKLKGLKKVTIQYV